MLAINNLRKYSRYQAATGHLVLSLLVLGVLGYLVYFCWYPQPLFSIDAGWQGLRILAFVDIVLGPCITLVIFNPKKKELFKDVAIIALIQISALSYGIYHVYQSRPAFVVYADNGFYTVAASELEHFSLSDQLLDEVSILGPSFKILTIPRTKHTIEYAVETDDFINYEKLQEIRFTSANRQTPFYLLEELLSPYNSNISTINNNSYSLEKILQELTGTSERNILQEWMIQHHNYNSFSYTSIIGRYSTVIVQINPASGQFLDYIPIKYHKGYL